MEHSTIHVVVLAAGRGSRLGVLGTEIPKWLLSIDGRTLAEHQLAAIHDAAEIQPDCIASVRIVTGHAAETITRFLTQRRDGDGQVDVEVVHNAQYAVLNNWYSLLLGLRSLSDTQHARVVVLNGDLLASREWMTQFFLDSARTTSSALVAIDPERTLTEESMKVSVRSDDWTSGSILARIGKLDIDNPAGEYVGMLMARGAALRALRNALESFVGCDETADAWYERAVGKTAQDGTRWTVWRTPDSRWVEIDDDADYVAAKKLLQRGSL